MADVTEGGGSFIAVYRRQESLEHTVEELQVRLTLQIESLQNQIHKQEARTAPLAKKTTAIATSNVQSTETDVSRLKGVEDGLAYLEKVRREMHLEQEKLEGKVEELVEKIIRAREQNVLSQVPRLEESHSDLTPVVDRLQERIAKCEEKLQDNKFLVQQTAKHSENLDKGEEVEGDMAVMTVMGVEANHNGIPDMGRESCNHEYDNSFEYEQLEESIWDMVLFIGLPQTGILGSVFVAMLVFVNASFQIALCLMINDTFTTPMINTAHVSAMRKWRVSFGHSTDLMDPFTYQSFVSKVCNSPLSTQMATAAAELHSIIGEYLPEKEDYEGASPIVGPILPYFKGIGISMSLMAIFVWIMEISITIQKLSHKRWAFKTVPVAAKSVLLHKGDSHQLVSISVQRKICIMTILLLEVFVILLLSFGGVFYIIRTIVLRDLLLNAAALVIVLEFDELVFAALVPHRSRYLLTTLEPLPRPLSSNFKGMSWSSVFSLTLIGVTVFLSQLELQSQASILEDTRFEICGGNQDFVVRQDRTGAITKAHVEPIDNLEDTYLYHAMRDLVTDDKVVHQWFARSGSVGTSGVEGGPWSLMTWTSMSLDTTIDYWNSGCSDFIPARDDGSTAHYWLHMLQDAVGDYSVKDCTDVLQYCNWDTLQGVRTRFVCPVSCGCTRPAAGHLVLQGSGCPTSCYEAAAFNNSMWSRDCEDFGLDSPYWSAYGKGFNEFLTAYPFWTNDDGLSDVMLSTHGCNLTMQTNIIFGYHWSDLCEADRWFNLKPLTYACPVSCECSSRFRPHCPYTCEVPT